MDTKLTTSRTFLSFPGCKTCFGRPCERLRFGRVYPGKFIFIHRRNLGFGDKGCPFVATSFDEVAQLLRDVTLVDLIRYVNDILYEMSPAEQLRAAVQDFVSSYNDFQGRVRFLSAVWDNNVLGVVRVPQFFSSDKGLSKWLLANEALDYQLHNDIKEEPDDKAAPTDSMAAQQAQAAPPPEEKQRITEIEVFVEGEKGPRKVNSDGTLEIVPDLLIGRKITCREVKGLSVTWTLDGYQTDTKNGSEATFQVRGWKKAISWPWFKREKPRICTVTAKDKNGKSLNARLNVFTGTQESTEIDYLQSPFFKSIQEAFDELDDLLLKLTGKGIEIRFLYGKIMYAAGFKEDGKSIKAFYGYDFMAGLNPVFSVKLKQEFGLARIIPKALENFNDVIKFELAVLGEWNLNGHYSKTSLEAAKPSMNSELKVGVEVNGGAKLEKSLFGKAKYKIIDAKLGSSTGVTGELGPLHNENGLGVKAQIKFDGIKLSGSIIAFDGIFVYKRDIVLIEEKVLLPEKELYIVGEHKVEASNRSTSA